VYQRNITDFRWPSIGKISGEIAID